MAVLLIVALAGALGQTSDTAGVRVVRAMHDRYAGKWFRTMTFVQTTTRRTWSGRDTIETWYESAAVPSLLRIDFGRPGDGNGVLYTADSTIVMEHGAVKEARAGGNDLTTLLFDVYFNPVDRTVGALRAQGFDLGIMHEATWQGRPVWVVGAAEGDDRSAQFWVDRERLIVLRQISSLGPHDTHMLDARFNKYRPIGQSWIAPECELLFDGKRVQLEEYADIKADVPLSPALFDSKHWLTAPHWVH
jgi:hypothetical protein